ncbi:MAG: phosphoribosylformylglycinamidine synthase subunit PurQ, partial [Clostridia bacterium]|nr:phosphoribosylformylglycinamidine synthase subunit PurQ [Clostridia bacterium]
HALLGKNAVSCYTITMGAMEEAVIKMCMGNGYGFEYDNSLSCQDIFGYRYGSFILEIEGETDEKVIGQITDNGIISYRDEKLSLEELEKGYESKLESVFNTKVEEENKIIDIPAYPEKIIKSANIKSAKPNVLIPVFPGTNCEYDSKKAVETAGAKAEIFVINNLTKQGVARSVEEFSQKIKSAQMIFIPGGFSGGDEPDGSGKFISAFFRNDAIKNEVHNLLKNRDGLMLGICNGFQVLIKLGLVPFGEIVDMDDDFPTLTLNTILRHQSIIVKTKVVSAKSPWLSAASAGEIYNVPISHGEGRFFANEKWIEKLSKNGQIATQYVDFDGNPTMDIRFNPNGSVYAVEGITSPDGRVFGKMGHSERIGKNLYKNVLGNYDMHLFESAVRYFK